jgi:hypothetical protein
MREECPVVMSKGGCYTKDTSAGTRTVEIKKQRRTFRIEAESVESDIRGCFGQGLRPDYQLARNV